MEIIQQLIYNLSNSSEKLSDSLRKALILFTIVEHNEAKEWVKSELDGYQEKKILPKYRQFRGYHIGDFVGYANSQIKNYPIPIELLKIDGWIKEFAKKQGNIYESIGNIVEMGENDYLNKKWPTEIVSVIGSDIIDNYVCLSIKTPISRSQLICIQEEVKNNLLLVLLELNTQFPNLLDGLNLNIPNKDKSIVAEVINNTLINTLNYNNGIEVNINKGNEKELFEVLQKLNIDSKDIKELKKLIDTDDKKNIKETVKGWIGNITQKVYGEGKDIALELVVKAVTQYINGN